MINDSYVTENADALLDLQSLAPFERSVYIAKNNLIVALKILFFGIFSLGIISALLLLYNGFLLGIAIGESLEFLTIGTIPKSTLPHCGEIVGLMILGYIAYEISVFLIFKAKHLSMLIILKMCIFGFVLIIVSAFIESYISFPPTSSP